ncbi:MAG: efflux RND transporter permease subunit [bacterium]|nr:efflux RND transporter permease subunit [bacterium]
MSALIQIFIRKPVMSAMLALACSMLGVISIPRLPVGLLPNLASPGITVITRYPGVSPEKIEELITIPVERSVSDIPGIEKIVATSSEGESRVNLIFDYNSDIKVNILETSERVRLVRSSWPREVNEPAIVRYDPSDKPVFIVTFASERHDLKVLREIVDRRFKPRFERVDGVSEVFVGGGFEREIQVLADPSRLSAHGVPVQPLASTISANNIFLPGGKLSGRGMAERYIYSYGRIDSIQEIGGLRFTAGEQGGTIEIRQLAEVRDHYRDRNSIAQTNGEDRVSVYVQKAGNANTLGITEACEKIVEGFDDLEEREGISYSVAYNQGTYIRRSIDRVTGAVISGAVIAVIVLYAFLRRARVTLIIGITIPASVLTTFFLMFLSGLELNVMSLSGLALGAGMLIDNSIVVSEAIDRRLRDMRERGGDATAAQAVRGATVGVQAEIVSATLTTIVVFIPLIFSNPETRKLYESLSLTVIYSLLVSLFFSLTVLPALILRFVSDGDAEAPGSISRAQQDQPGAAVQRFFESLPAGLRRVLALLGKPFVYVWRWLDSLRVEDIAQWYRLRSRVVFRNIVPAFAVPVLVLAVSPLLFGVIEKEFVSPVDSNDIEASVDLETGTHLEYTQRITNRIEAAVRTHPAVKEVNAKVEKSRATLNIKLDSEQTRFQSAADTINELRKITDPIEDAFVYYNEAGEGSGGRELDLEFFGDDTAVIKAFAREVSALVQGKVEGVDQAILRFRDGKQDILLYPYKTKLAQNRTSTQEIGQTLRQFMSGTIITKFYDGDREVDVRLQGRPGTLDTPADVAGFMLPLAQRTVPLRSIVAFESGAGETRLWRKNKRKSVGITFKIKSRSVDAVAEDIDRVMAGVEPPPDTIYGFGDEYEKLKESQREMLIAIGLSIVIIYMLLAFLFESYSQPLIIMVTVPLTATGVLVFLAVTRMPLNMSVYIGLIMLGGIVVNNAILVVSTVNKALAVQAEADGMPVGSQLIRPILRAASFRIRPILMTTLTTVFGLLPMVVDFSEGSGLWRPLAITVSFGLTLSLFVSLVLVPFASYLYYRMIAPRSL